MARKVVTKEITFTDLLLSKVSVENGQVVNGEPFHYQAAGKLNQSQIDKLLKKEFKGETVVCIAVNENTKHYRMEIDKFLELAEEYEPRRSEN